MAAHPISTYLQMVNDYVNGIKLKDICAKYHCTDESIRHAAKQCHIPIRPVIISEYRAWAIQAKATFKLFKDTNGRMS